MGMIKLSIPATGQVPNLGLEVEKLQMKRLEDRIQTYLE